MGNVIAKEEKEEEVQSPYDRGKTDPPTKEELKARKEMFADQAEYDKLFFKMNHPEGKTSKEIEAYIRSVRDDLESAKKKWNKSINKHANIRSRRM